MAAGVNKQKELDKALIAIADTYHDFESGRCSSALSSAKIQSIFPDFSDVIPDKIPLDRKYIYEGTNHPRDKTYKGRDLEETVLNMLDLCYKDADNNTLTIPTENITNLSSEPTKNEVKQKILGFFSNAQGQPQGNIGIIFDQFALKFIEHISDEYKTGEYGKIYNINPICGLWDEAGKAGNNRIDVSIRIDGAGSNVHIPYTNEVGFGLIYPNATYLPQPEDQNYVSVFSENNKLYEGELNKNILNISVGKLCQAYDEAVSKKNPDIMSIVFNPIKKNNSSVIRKDAAIYNTVSSIFTKELFTKMKHTHLKRSGDFGQVAMVKHLNTHAKNNPNIYIYDYNNVNKKSIKRSGIPEAMNNKPTQWVLMTGDRLCYARARLEGIPVIFNKDSEVILYKGESQVMSYREYYEKLLEYIQLVIDRKLKEENYNLQTCITIFQGRMTLTDALDEYKEYVEKCKSYGSSVDKCVKDLLTDWNKLLSTLVQLRNLMRSKNCRFLRTKHKINQLLTDKTYEKELNKSVGSSCIIKLTIVDEAILSDWHTLSTLVTVELPSTIFDYMTSKISDPFMKFLSTIHLTPSFVMHPFDLDDAFKELEVPYQNRKFITAVASVSDNKPLTTAHLLKCFNDNLKKKRFGSTRGLAKKFDGLVFNHPLDALSHALQLQCELYCSNISTYKDKVSAQISNIKEYIDGLNMFPGAGSEAAGGGLKTNMQETEMEGGGCEDAVYMDLNTILCNSAKYMKSLIKEEDLEDIQTAMNQVMYCYNIHLNSWTIQSAISVKFDDLMTTPPQTTKNGILEHIEAAVTSTLQSFLKKANFAGVNLEDKPYKLNRVYKFLAEIRKGYLESIQQLDFSEIATRMFTSLQNLDNGVNAILVVDDYYDKNFKDIDTVFVKDEVNTFVKFITIYVNEEFEAIYKLAFEYEYWKDVFNDLTEGKGMVIMSKSPDIGQKTIKYNTFDPTGRPLTTEPQESPVQDLGGSEMQPVLGIFGTQPNEPGGTISPERQGQPPSTSSPTKTFTVFSGPVDETFKDIKGDIFYKVFVDAEDQQDNEIKRLNNFSKIYKDIKTQVADPTLSPESIYKIKIQLYKALAGIQTKGVAGTSGQGQEQATAAIGGGVAKKKYSLRDYHRKYYPAYYEHYY